jgi:hypothetical protein
MGGVLFFYRLTWDRTISLLSPVTYQGEVAPPPGSSVYGLAESNANICGIVYVNNVKKALDYVGAAITHHLSFLTRGSSNLPIPFFPQLPHSCLPQLSPTLPLSRE